MGPQRVPELNDVVEFLTGPHRGKEGVVVDVRITQRGWGYQRECGYVVQLSSAHMVEVASDELVVRHHIGQCHRR